MYQFPETGTFPPLKFIPAYQERIWGGTLMSELLKRRLPSDVRIGEAWEISDRNGAESVVAEGPLAGVPLSALVRHYGRALVGGKAPDAERFPLLVKLIDAGERLSLQVHPDEQCCRRLADGSEPKTEMWYVIAARKGARIMAGLSPRATKLQFMELFNSPEIEQLLQSFPSVPGDAYYIPAGLLHAIDAGNLLLEVQQNSNTTYRLSDWGRGANDGSTRELHLQKGMEAIDFFNRETLRIPGSVDRRDFNRKYPLVHESPCFRVTELRLIKSWRENTLPDDSFHILSAINGRIVLENEDRSLRTELETGSSALVPAAFGCYYITPVEDGETTVLKTTL
jgi:mannose-6-phosphate isomerase